MQTNSIAVAGLLLMAGCAALQPTSSTSAPYVPATVLNSQQKPINIPPDPLVALDPAVRAAYESGEPKTKDGITIYYAYSPHASYDVDCPTLRVTDIEFNPDETIVKHGINIGDSARWLVDATDHNVTVKANPTAGVALNTGNVAIPTSGFSTNLLVETDKRIYHFTLHATQKQWTQQVTFYYPDDIRRATQARVDAQHKAAIQVSQAQKPLNFAYRIEGPNVAWKPIMAFDDGERAYIQIPENTYGEDSPVLYVESGGQLAATNYQVNHSYYVTDRLFREAALTSGVGAHKETVQVERMN